LTDGELKGNVSEDAMIAHRLICSVGNKYQCEGRVSIVKFFNWVFSANEIGLDSLSWFNLTDGELKGNVSEDAMIAHRLICSVGNKYQCEGRLGFLLKVGKVRLVDGTQTINNDGFYNYLTAWYNQDNMMYYVSQGSFYPTPPKWSITDKKAPLLVPPAEPLAYSQIPFYLTGLTDTPVIIEMIKVGWKILPLAEIRATCDQFVEQGLPNFPQGIAFTFWEQYLHLNGNLLTVSGCWWNELMPDDIDNELGRTYAG
uniref:DUF5703_N domain-containing protein n=1 Tax=Heligmosomoides polygyrus TaxID=6339 RepID=A0A183GWC0_HELPZ